MAEDWSSKRKISFKKHSHRGIFPTHKVTENFVQFESSLERDFFLLVDHDPSVIIFQHQRHSIKYTDGNGKKKAYRPDAKVKFRNQSKNVVFEIKRQNDLDDNKKKYFHKFEAAKKFAKETGMVFIKVTERQIRTPRFYNVWFTKGSSRATENEQYFDKVTSLLVPSIGVRYNELVMKISQLIQVDFGKASQILCYFIYHGDVFIPTFSSKKMNAGTLIYLKEDGTGSSFASLYDEFKVDEMEEPLEHIKSSITQISEKEDEKPLITELWGVPPEFQKLVEMKMKLLDEWIKKFNGRGKSDELLKQSFLKKWRKKWETEFDKSFSERTLKRWLKSYRQEGIDGLVPNFNQRGRKRNYSNIAEETFEEGRTYYLRNKSKITIQYAHYEYLKLCKEKNLEDYEILPLSTFSNYIYRYSSKAELDMGQWGSSKYDTMYDPSYTQFPDPIMPMQIVELDNSQFDQFIVDSEFRDSIPPPWLTAGIDDYTMMITGYYLSLEHPSSTSVVETVLQSIMPKEDICVNYNIDPQQWRIEGYPVLLLIDNGRDYTANALIDFALENGIIIEYARLGKGKDKPHIEQWFRRVWDAVKNEGAGGYRPPTVDRILNKDYDPETEAIFTLSELEDWFISWMLETYHESTRSNNMKPSPKSKLENSYQVSGQIILPIPQEPPSLWTNKGRWQFAEMKKHVLIKGNYKITNNGIRRLYLEYNSPELQALYKHIGTKGKKAEVFLDRRDIRQIWVKHDDFSSYIRVPIYGEWYEEMQKIPALRDKPISDNQWKSMRKIITTANLRVSNPDKLHEAYEKRQEIITKAKAGVKSAKRQSKGIRRQREKIRQTEERLVTDTVELEEPGEEFELEIPEQNVEIPVLKPQEEEEHEFEEDDEDGVVLPTISKKLVKGER